MFSISRSSRHWVGVALLFGSDLILVWISFLFGTLHRFGEPAWDKLAAYSPGIGVASIALPCIFYIGGLYSQSRSAEKLVLLRWLIAGWSAVGAVVLVMGSLDFSSRVGRGVLLASMAVLLPLTAIFHIFLHRLFSRRWRTAFCLVSNEADERVANLLNRLWSRNAKLLGVISGNNYRISSSLSVVGDIQDLSVNFSQQVDLILVRDRHLADPAFGPLLRQMRYRGVEIVSLADACEDAYRAVPIDLVTENWLFRACNQSDLFYIKKLKRAFDIVTSLLLLPVLYPLMLLGMLIVRVSSAGPVFFRQERSGRLGKPFTILKLRTMHLDSEIKGPQWSGDGDPRVFPMGKWLRRFRIDEIPQLWNVLRGDMSFVGPRPEQPSFVDELALEIPWYRERLLIQPGLTGWAQVRYPYGANKEDAVRKLEYDLYYMKHMSLLLDFFILIETVRTVLFGGVKLSKMDEYSAFREELKPLYPAEKPGI